MNPLTVLGASTLGELRPGGHASWVVDDPADYVRWAATALDDAARFDQKPCLFGPPGDARAQLAGRAAVVADPYADILGGRFDASAMYDMFRTETVRARSDGYRGLRLVADMDWLLPCSPSQEDVVAFELGLDRLVTELDATIVCAYRSASFGPVEASRTACVHSLDVRSGPPPPFRFVAKDARTWSLAGEVDIAVEASFAAAVSGAAGFEPCDIDMSELSYIDVGGLRALADAARRGRRRIRLLHVNAPTCRMWTACGFDAAAPSVELVPA